MGTTVSATSPWATSGAVTAPEARLAASTHWAKSPTSSIATEGGIPEGATPSLAISSGAARIGPHHAIVENANGTWECTWPTAANVTLDSVPASGTSRFDLIVGEVSGGDTGAVYQLRSITGTASANPSEPSAPSGTVPIAVYPVTNAGPQTPSPRYPFTRAPGGVRLVAPGQGDQAAGSYVGDRRKRADGSEDVWTGSAWLSIVAPASWTQVSPITLYANGQGSNAAGEVGLGTGGTKICRYKRVGNDLTISYAFRWGTAPYTNPAGRVTTVLPLSAVTPSSRDQWIPAQIWVNDTPASKVNLDFAGMALVQAGSNILRPYYPRSNGSGGFATGILPYVIATGAGPGNSIPYIAAGYAQGGTVHIGPALVEIAG